MSDPLTHFNDQNRAKMVDVTAKQVTARTATATGTIRMQPATLDRIHAGTMKKGTYSPCPKWPGSWPLSKPAI